MDIFETIKYILNVLIYIIFFSELAIACQIHGLKGKTDNYIQTNMLGEVGRRVAILKYKLRIYYLNQCMSILSRILFFICVLQLVVEIFYFRISTDAVSEMIGLSILSLFNICVSFRYIKLNIRLYNNIRRYGVNLWNVYKRTEEVSWK